MAGTSIKTDEVLQVLHSIPPKNHELQKETGESSDDESVDIITEENTLYLNCDHLFGESSSLGADILHKDKQLDTEKTMDSNIFIEPTGTDLIGFNNSPTEEHGEAEINKLSEAKTLGKRKPNNQNNREVDCTNDTFSKDQGPLKKKKLTKLHGKRTQFDRESLKDQGREVQEKDNKCKTDNLSSPTNDDILSGPSSSIEADDLLDDEKLTQLRSREPRTSLKVKEECQKICERIKSKSKHIWHVEPTYTDYDQTNVTFLVFAKKRLKLK